MALPGCRAPTSPAGTRVPKADAMIIIVRHTRIHPCLPRGTIRRSRTAIARQVPGRAETVDLDADGAPWPMEF